MAPHRLAKSLARRLKVSWREQPTQRDIEALEANIERVGLVIRVRWAIVGALGLFSVAAAAVYGASGLLSQMVGLMVVPAAGLALVLAYNLYNQSKYRQLGNITLFNVAQLLVDILVVTVLIHYSGGVYSWFHAMYLLFVLEAAMILPTRRGVWAIAGSAMAAYSTVLLLQYYGVLVPVEMPFVTGELTTVAPYVVVRALWTLTVVAGTATVGTMLMDEVRSRESRLIAQSIRDAHTGLYNRDYIRRQLAFEIERSKRFDRGVSLLMADIDGFERFNTAFGHSAGQSMLIKVADALRGSVRENEDTLAIVARYGGEEFAVVVPESSPGACQEGAKLAERLRVAIEQVRDEDRSVTVSIGVACYPDDGRTASELIGGADGALSQAAASGGNSVASGRGATSA